MRKICVVTGARAEFGLLVWLMREIAGNPDLKLQVIATGAHLSPEFGSTYREIEDAAINIDAKVEMLLSGDTSIATTKSVGLGVIGFADAYACLKPDIVVVLGDRYEIFAAAASALFAGLPIAHLHGGETTEGAFDEAIRHSITKMAHLHFVATEVYRRRVIQLGEAPCRVFNVGGLGIDAIKRIGVLNREELEAQLGFKFGSKSLLITFHPITLEHGDSSPAQLAELLSALSNFGDSSLIFTAPNSDTGSRWLSKMISDFVTDHKNAHFFTSLGQLKYFSCLAQVDGVIGNSSSGLAEAPSFGVGTVNIGDRQKGRLKAESVIDCQPESAAIASAIERLYSSEFRQKLKAVQNPYGNGGASVSISKLLATIELDGILKKEFYDLPFIEVE